MKQSPEWICSSVSAPPPASAVGFLLGAPAAFLKKLGRSGSALAHPRLRQTGAVTASMAFPGGGLLPILPLLLLVLPPVGSRAEEPHAAGTEAPRGESTAPPGCPWDCACAAEGAVDCAGVGLTRFPTGLPPDTRRVALQNNNIEEIRAEDLSNLDQLETLNLQNNRLTTHGLEDGGLETLEGLAYLYLANNQLTRTPAALPPGLVSADFAANRLSRISPGTFGGKPRLKSVYLHDNKLTDQGLPAELFRASDGLEILTLSSNLLSAVPGNLPPGLVRLHLKSNKLERIPAGALDGLPNLRELHLQNNLLNDESVDNRTFGQVSALECLDLSNNNLSAVPKGLPANLVLLHLEKNSIQGIPADALTHVRQLEYLLLHNNHLRSRSIHPAAFQGLKKLHTLHMHNNQLERVPRGLPRRAKTLVLLRNAISEIGRNDLAALHTLSELDLSYNRLSEGKLHRDAFRKLRRLETLRLSGNALRSLPVALPRGLRLLEAKGAGMEALPEGALAGMESLRVLILADNRLALNSFYQGAWMELAALTTLDLSGNRLSHVPSDLPESLEHLDLRGNRIASIAASAFEGLPNIQKINLRFNRLSASALDDSSLALLGQKIDIGDEDDQEGSERR
ncbi:podocan isoform X2 [Stigmatopora argus]